jgi:hypothetical protein
MSADAEALKLMFSLLDRQRCLEPQEGDYAEEDENGVVHIKRKDGQAVLMMDRRLYEQLKEQGEHNGNR